MPNLYAGYLGLIAMAQAFDIGAAYDMQAAYVKQFTSRDPELNELVEDGTDELLAIAQRANDGELTQQEFKQEYLSALLLLLLSAGARAGGVDDPDLLPQGALIEIDKVYRSSVANIDSIVADIYGGRYQAREDAAPRRPAQTAEEALSKLRNRVLLWGISIAAAVSLGRLYTHEKLEWNYGPTEHCPDCRRLHGQVHTRHEWIKSGWRTQGHMLHCGGKNCQCQLIPVDASTPDRGNF